MILPFLVPETLNRPFSFDTVPIVVPLTTTLAKGMSCPLEVIFPFILNPSPGLVAIDAVLNAKNTIMLIKSAFTFIF